MQYKTTLLVEDNPDDVELTLWALKKNKIFTHSNPYHIKRRTGYCNGLQPEREQLRAETGRFQPVYLCGKSSRHILVTAQPRTINDIKEDYYNENTIEDFGS